MHSLENMYHGCLLTACMSARRHWRASQRGQHGDQHMRHTCTTQVSGSRVREGGREGGREKENMTVWQDAQWIPSRCSTCSVEPRWSSTAQTLNSRAVRGLAQPRTLYTRIPQPRAVASTAVAYPSSVPRGKNSGPCLQSYTVHICTDAGWCCLWDERSARPRRT